MFLHTCLHTEATQLMFFHTHTEAATTLHPTTPGILTLSTATDTWATMTDMCHQLTLTDTWATMTVMSHQHTHTPLMNQCILAQSDPTLETTIMFLQ